MKSSDLVKELDSLRLIKENNKTIKIFASIRFLPSAYNKTENTKLLEIYEIGYYVDKKQRGISLTSGTYQFGGQKVFVSDGAARLASGTLAGSILRLEEALKNVSSAVKDLSFTDLIDLVTKNPARNLGINNIGSIKVGNLANFTIITKGLKVIDTIINR